MMTIVYILQILHTALMRFVRVEQSRTAFGLRFRWRRWHRDIGIETGPESKACPVTTTVVWPHHGRPTETRTVCVLSKHKDGDTIYPSHTVVRKSVDSAQDFASSETEMNVEAPGFASSRAYSLLAVKFATSTYCSTAYLFWCISFGTV